MKSVRPGIWILVAISVLLLGLLLWNFAARHTTEPRAERPQQQRPDQTLSEETPKPTQVQRREEATAQPSFTASAVAPSNGAAAAKLEQALRGRNVPIDFWGRLLDQSGGPIAGGTVQARVRQWGTVPGLATLSDADKYTVESGADGIFHITGVTGDVLAIETIQKEGYVLSAKADRSFNYLNRDSYLPDEQNPYVFRMWKLAASEPLKTIHTSKLIPYDGRPVWIDLAAGRILEGNTSQGDLKITLERSPLEIAVNRREPFDWHATITASAGGVVTSTDEFMYLAPTVGYKESLQISMPRTATNWTAIKQVPLYVKGRNGQLYGRATLEFRADYSGPTTGFTIDAAINLNGSPNLQP